LVQDYKIYLATKKANSTS